VTNEEYVAFIGATGEARHACLKAMAKYAENHWWEPAIDDRTFAYYQMKEPIEIDGSGNGSRLKRGLMALLNRDVYPHEVVFNTTALMQEIERAWHA
jgi:hypothetical protein